ncbi:MAG TPA: aminoglycoside adenylyltransferase domain-containing protein [Candidatus Limnocylindrales bacterium]|nr:aminoglycoside adenylyltransferase domain-containing protein [Candidatus Limnocylindrales bacterium]
MDRIVVDAPVEPIATWIAAALGADLVGLYLYGSAVSGSYEPDVSDLDLVAVTRRDAAVLDLARLEGARRKFVADHPEWDNRLELVVIGAETLRAFRTTAADLAVVSPGEPLHLSGPVRDWTQNWFLLRQTALTLRGRAAREVLPEVSAAEFRSAVATYAGWLASQDLEAHSPGALAYAVLSECRALCTLQTGRPPSKAEGAEWLARQRPDWASVIDAALACRRAGGATGFDEPGTKAAAIELIGSVARSIRTGPLAV